MNATIKTKQEQMYVDMVQLIANIAKEGFGIDVIHNPLFSGVFRQQLERHHDKLVSFITRYVPDEPLSVNIPSAERVNQEHTAIQPKPNVNADPPGFENHPSREG